MFSTPPGREGPRVGGGRAARGGVRVAAEGGGGGAARGARAVAAQARAAQGRAHRLLAQGEQVRLARGRREGRKLVADLENKTE